MMSIPDAVAEGIRGMRAQPIMILLLFLNVSGIGGGLWFMDVLTQRMYGQHDLIIRLCLPHHELMKIPP